MNLFTQSIISGLMTGAVYTFLGIGLVLVYRTARILNLAHGAFYMLGAYFTYLFAALLGLPLALAALAALAGFLALYFGAAAAFFRHFSGKWRVKPAWAAMLFHLSLG